jgi:hypothetical protein
LAIDLVFLLRGEPFRLRLAGALGKRMPWYAALLKKMNLPTD